MAAGVSNRLGAGLDVGEGTVGPCNGELEIGKVSARPEVAEVLFVRLAGGQDGPKAGDLLSRTAEKLAFRELEGAQAGRRHESQAVVGVGFPQPVGAEFGNVVEAAPAFLQRLAQQRRVLDRTIMPVGVDDPRGRAAHPDGLVTLGKLSASSASHRFPSLGVHDAIRARSLLASALPQEESF